MKSMLSLSDGKSTGYWHSKPDYAPQHASNTSDYFLEGLWGGSVYYNNGSWTDAKATPPQLCQPNHARPAHDLKSGRHVEGVENAEQAQSRCPEQHTRQNQHDYGHE